MLVRKTSAVPVDWDTKHSLLPLISHGCLQRGATERYRIVSTMLWIVRKDGNPPVCGVRQ
jgi:hypothetical protein